MNLLSISLQALVASSIFFVWVVRYHNIVQAFKSYGLPDGLRDVVGILKLTFSLMLLIGIEQRLLAVIGAMGISILMVCAFATHVRVKSPLVQRLPSLSLLLISLVIIFINYPAIKG